MAENDGVPAQGRGPGWWIESLNQGLTRVANVVLILALSGIVIVISVGVLSRASNFFLFVGGEELTRLFLAWAVLVYLGVSYRARTFIRMRMVYGVVSERFRLVVEVIERVIVISFCWLLLTTGTSWTVFQHSIGRRSITSLGTPGWIQTLAVPVGAVMLLVAALSRSPRQDAKDELPDGEAL